MPSNNISINNSPILTKIYRGYSPDGRFIHDMILPSVKVASKTAQARQWASTALDPLRIHNNVIVGKSKTPEITVEMTKASLYTTERHGLKIGVTKEDGQEYNPTDYQAGMAEAKIDFAEMLKWAQMLGKEYALSQALFNTSNFTYNSTLAGSDQWSNYSTSSPITDVRAARTSVYTYSGEAANVGITSQEVMFILQNHPELKRTNGVAPDGTVPVRELTELEVAKALGLDRILVGKVKYETANIGQTSSLTNVWGKYFLVAYINPNPQPKKWQRSLGYSFVLDQPVIDTYVENDPKYTEFVRVEEEYDDVILDETAGYLLAAVIA